MGSFADDCACQHRAGSHTNLGCSQCPCALPFGQAGIDLTLIEDEGKKDPYWLHHDGYPRDMTDAEQLAHDRQVEVAKAAAGMNSTSITLGQMGASMRTAFEMVQDSLEVGDKVALRGRDGKVTKAKLGEQFVGTVEKVEHDTQMVVVRMGN